MLRERRAGEGDEEEEDDEDGARDRELVAQAEPDALPVAAGRDRRDLVVLLRELRTEEAAFEIALEVVRSGPARSQRVALRNARLALQLRRLRRGCLV